MGASEVVFEMAAALTAGDVDSARPYWRDDAVWHSGGVFNTDPYAGDYNPDEYMALAQRFMRDHPDYRAEVEDVREIGSELIAFRLKSWSSQGPHGELDGSGALMVYRVLDGKIVEGWGINARHDRPA